MTTTTTSSTSTSLQGLVQFPLKKYKATDVFGNDYPFVQRERVQEQMIEVALSNFQNRGKSISQDHTLIIITGGSGIGKTRAGYETSQLKPILQKMTGIDTQFSLSMEEPLYLFINIFSGFTYRLDNPLSDISVMIGVRLALSCGMFGVGGRPFRSIDQIIDFSPGLAHQTQDGSKVFKSMIEVIGHTSLWDNIIRGGLADTGYIPKDVSFFLDLCRSKPQEFSRETFFKIHNLNQPAGRPLDDLDYKKLCQLSFTSHPVTLSDKLPSGATIDDLRLKGLLYLLPIEDTVTTSITGGTATPSNYRLYLSFYNLNSFNFSIVLFVKPTFNFPTSSVAPRVPSISSGAIAKDGYPNTNVNYELESSLTNINVTHSPNIASNVPITSDIRDTRCILKWSQNPTPKIDYRFVFKMEDGHIIFVNVQSKENVKNSKMETTLILENANLVSKNFETLWRATKAPPNSDQQTYTVASKTEWSLIYLLVTNRVVDQDVIDQYAKMKSMGGNGDSPTNHIRPNHYLIVVSADNFQEFFGDALTHRGLMVQPSDDEIDDDTTDSSLPIE
ncbi:hypothetical protein SAMD00019534_099720 [Acytostelium subglobosum LB1]|uniref:hypothetical protein n=1 Tax=Acytostelium subglobosum LB1 TaxID=1410327 RepID=UPI000645077F|nr:hypothetical protein SAMD00019534_099720 [Acytostelium subglobosum LB1]GAM26797.1 hypothetical protein SAMD00019534_099720 [Acytostelium subglobosum LB1]|eukprot:XP_012750458.1 hypothetical protein SAMD00019534_099720 [Acytostelium subglobosum LB1]